MTIQELQIARDKLLEENPTLDYIEGVLDMYNAVVKLEKGEG